MDFILYGRCRKVLSKGARESVFRLTLQGGGGWGGCGWESWRWRIQLGGASRWQSRQDGSVEQRRDSEIGRKGRKDSGCTPQVK